MNAKINREMMIPDLLRRFPVCRPVLDRYGLSGCGGESGPQEPIWFFARAHHIPEERILAELELAASGQAKAPEVPPPYEPGPADVIYRRFFKAAILTMFTFGCVMGGVNLAVLALRHQMAAMDMRALIWAHAHAQVAGWVTFFVMGFAYQAIPHFKFTPLWRPRLAAATLSVMASALTVRALADLWQSNAIWRRAGMAAGLAELAVVAAFVLILLQTFRSSKLPCEPYEKFVYAALGWMVTAFAVDLWVFCASSRLRGAEEWIGFIAQYDAPWRTIQLLGFASLMILGVSQRFLPAILGFREVPRRVSSAIFYTWNLSVLGQIFGYALLIRTGNALWGLVLELSVAGLVICIVSLAVSFRLYSTRVEADRSVRFIRAAYGWAGLALVMLLFLPVYDALMGLGFSHAYFGAYRHALTVGFISMMIVGVSSRVVPVLSGADPRTLSSLSVPFWLINAGNTMRIVFQILTDSQSWAYPLMGASAWIEVTGLAWWAVDLWRAMNHHPASPALEEPFAITPQTKVAAVLDHYPQSVAVFLAFGFSMINQPMARRVFARSVTLGEACRLRHVDYRVFVEALQKSNAVPPEPAHNKLLPAESLLRV